MASAGSLNLFFNADTSNAKRGLQSLQRETGKTTSALGKMGSGFKSLIGGLNPMTLSIGALGAGIGALAAKTAQANKETALWADRLGVSATELDALAKVAKNYGGSLDDVGDSMKDLNERIADAAGGNKTYEEALNKVGLASKDLINLPVEQQFLKVADAIGKLNNVGDQNFVTAELMADAGFRLLPMFREGEVAIRGMTDKLKENGMVMSETAATASHDMSRAFNALGSVIDGLGNKFINMVDNFSEGGGFFRDFAVMLERMAGTGETVSQQLERFRIEAAQSVAKEKEAALKRESDARNEAVNKELAEIQKIHHKRELFHKINMINMKAEEDYKKRKKIEKTQARIDSLRESLEVGAETTNTMSFTAKVFNPNEMKLGGASAERISQQVKLQMEQKELARQQRDELKRQTEILENLRSAPSNLGSST
jgi:hypothetical protein